MSHLDLIRYAMRSDVTMDGTRPVLAKKVRMLSCTHSLYIVSSYNLPDFHHCCPRSHCRYRISRHRVCIACYYI